MLKGERITLLVIPEAGGKTFELKLPRLLIGLSGLAGILLVILLALGLKYYLEARDLGRTVARLEREKSLLEEEVGQIEQLEQVLLRLQKSNQQLRAILGESVGMGFEKEYPETGNGGESYVGAIDRLRWGHVRSFPGMWPVDGVVVRPFSERFPGTVIATPERSLVRASASGQVVRAGFDTRLGYLVVVDHGNGLSSQYGYNSRLLVETGDYVEKGQPLSLSGHSGEAERPSLYYAIRERGRARDPAAYRLWL